MSKIQVFFLSLVGALPAGFLSYLLGMYLINQPSGANSVVMIISIITLICSATLTLTPFLILALYYSNYDHPPAASKSTRQTDDLEELDDADDTEAVPGKKAVANAADTDEFAEEEMTDEVPLDDEEFATMDDDDFATLDDDDLQAMDDEEK